MSTSHNHNSEQTLPVGFVTVADLEPLRRVDTPGIAAERIKSITLDALLAQIHPWELEDDKVLALGFYATAAAQHILATNVVVVAEEKNEYLGKGVVTDIVHDFAETLWGIAYGQIGYADGIIRTDKDNIYIVDDTMVQALNPESQLPAWPDTKVAPVSLVEGMHRAFNELYGWLDSTCWPHNVDMPDLTPALASYAAYIIDKRDNALAIHEDATVFVDSSTDLATMDADYFTEAYDTVHTAFTEIMAVGVYSLAARVADSEMVARVEK